MSVATFDTLKYVQRLEKAGLTREQAAAMAEAQKEVFAEAIDLKMATAQDLEALRMKVDYEFKLVKWMIGLSLAMSAGILSVLGRIFFAMPK